MGKAKIQQLIRYSFQYAVKFICTSNIPATSQHTSAFLPGSYLIEAKIDNRNVERSNSEKRSHRQLVVLSFVPVNSTKMHPYVLRRNHLMKKM